MNMSETYTLKFMTSLYIGLNALIVLSLSIYIFFLLYYDFDKKRIKKKIKELSKVTQVQTIGDKLFNLAFCVGVTLWVVIGLIIFLNSKLDSFTVRYKNCLYSVENDYAVDIDVINSTNDDLIIYKNISNYLRYIIDEDTKKQIYSFEYIKLYKEK